MLSKNQIQFYSVLIATLTSQLAWSVTFDVEQLKDAILAAEVTNFVKNGAVNEGIRDQLEANLTDLMKNNAYQAARTAGNTDTASQMALSLLWDAKEKAQVPIVSTPLSTFGTTGSLGPSTVSSIFGGKGGAADMGHAAPAVPFADISGGPGSDGAQLRIKFVELDQRLDPATKAAFEREISAQNTQLQSAAQSFEAQAISAQNRMFKLRRALTDYNTALANGKSVTEVRAIFAAMPNGGNGVLFSLLGVGAFGFSGSHDRPGNSSNRKSTANKIKGASPSNSVNSSGSGPVRTSTTGTY